MEKSEKVIACYCRTAASNNQPEGSIEDQKKILAEFAAKKGMKPVFFIDNCSTGKHQTALRKLVKNIKASIWWKSSKVMLEKRIASKS